MSDQSARNAHAEIALKHVVRDLSECGELLVSAGTAAALEEVLRNPKFDRYVSRGLRRRVPDCLPEFGTHVAIAERIQAYRDPEIVSLGRHRLSERLPAGALARSFARHVHYNPALRRPA